MNGTTSLDDLRLFLGVARAASFVEAARRARVPASTLSRRIAALEAHLGVRLLQRTSRSVTLTQEGARLAERTLASVETIENAFEGARSTEAPAGRLRVTAPLVSGAERIGPALYAFAARYPAVQLDLVLTNAELDLVEAEIDLAFRAGPITDRRLVARRLYSQPFELAAAPAFVRSELGGRARLELERLAQLPAVVSRRSPWRFRRGTQVKSVSPNARVLVSDPRAAVSAAAAGLGLLCAPRELLTASSLVPVAVRGYRPEPRELFVVFPSRSLLPSRVRLAIDWVVDALAVAPGPGR